MISVVERIRKCTCVEIAHEVPPALVAGDQNPSLPACSMITFFLRRCCIEGTRQLNASSTEHVAG